MIAIPFNRPLLVGTEADAVAETLASGELAGGGLRTRACEDWFRAHTGAPLALMTPSCTQALELAALVADIRPGDEVILPSWTFVSTASAFVLRGATPVFVDISPHTGNIDPMQIEAAITDRTRAIVPVHYAGVSCDMDMIMAIANRHELLVIEDAAQGVMARWRDRPLGSIGHLGAYSFHATKNYTSGGEGGLLLVNDERFAARAEILREKGTDRRAFQRGDVQRYTWQATGSSYLPSEVQAACLWAQLQQAEPVNRRRRALWEAYTAALTGVPGLTLLKPPAEAEHNGHLFAVRLPDATIREQVRQSLADAGIAAHTHYVPLHSAPAGQEFGRIVGSLAHTQSVADTLLRLPLHYALSDAEQAQVIEATCRAVNVALN